MKASHACLLRADAFPVLEYDPPLKPAVDRIPSLVEEKARDRAASLLPIRGAGHGVQ